MRRGGSRNIEREGLKVIKRLTVYRDPVSMQHCPPRDVPEKMC